MSYAEYREWQVFYEVEPWGCEMDDMRTAIVARTVANGLRGADTPPFSLADFMPTRKAPVDEPVDEPVLSDDELAAWADAAIYGLPPE